VTKNKNRMTEDFLEDMNLTKDETDKDAEKFMKYI
jgi:hypothetical protein